MYVTAHHLNVRSEGTFRSSIVATVDSGYKVVLLEKLANGWDKVLLENGQVGYVNARYLASAEPYFEKAEGSEYEVSVPSAFVRSEGLQKKIAVLHRGDRLEALDRKIFLQKWIRVRVVNTEKDGYIGRVGYISKNIVRVVEGTRYQEEVPALNSAPEEELTVNSDWIGDNTGNITLNSAPQEVTTDSTSTGSTDDGSLEDFLGGFLNDTVDTTTSTGTNIPASTGATSNTGTTSSTGGTAADSSIDDFFGSLLN